MINKLKNKLFDYKKIEEIAVSIIHQHEKNEIIQTIISPRIKEKSLSLDFMNDLELFNGNYGDYTKSIISKLDHTKTSIGKIKFEHLLGNPVTNINELNQRKNLLIDLNNLKINDQVLNNLCIIKTLENDIFWLWKQKGKEIDEFFNRVYFNNVIMKRFNKNERLMNFKSYYKILISPFISVFYPIIAIIIPFLMVRFVFKIKIPFKFYKTIVQSTMGFSGGLFPQLNNNKLMKLSKFISSFLWIILYLNSGYVALDGAISTNKIINIIHKKIISISKFLSHFEAIQNLIDHKYIERLQNPFENLKIYLDDSQNKFFNNKGRILIDYRKILNQKDKFIPIINYIGNIDMYFSILNVYNLNKFDHHYSYPIYLNADQPSIQIEKVWHPYLNKHNVVKNNILIGNKEKNNLIITGPNAGGKSTFIKSLMLAILFAQTIIISPCKELKFTPFYNLTTYLNIPDCKGKESLFEAEMNRSLEYIQKLKITEKLNKFTLVMMDEIFNSTNPMEGISGAYAICKKIGSFKNSLSLITTHFNYLTSLEKTSPYFVNYKMQIVKNGDKISYPYKIYKGISTQFIAIQLLEKKGFDQEILDDANKIYKKLKKQDKIKKTKKKKKNKIVKKLKQIENIIENKIELS